MLVLRVEVREVISGAGEATVFVPVTDPYGGRCTAVASLVGW